MSHTLILQSADPVLGLFLGLFLLLFVAPLLAGAGLGAIPVLISQRLKKLFESLPPTGYASVSYSLLVVVLYILWLVIFGIALSDPASTQSNVATFLGIPAFALLSTIGFSAGAVLVLPRLGLHWFEDDGPFGSGLLALCWAGLYTAPIAVTFFFFAVVARYPG